MGINLGRWFKRQVLGNKPVTLGNTFAALAKPLGYSGTPAQIAQAMVLDVVGGQLSVKDVESVATLEGKRLLNDAIGQAQEQLKALNLALANARTQ